MKNKILIVYTGGTICSFLDNNVKKVNIEMAKSVIIDIFEKGDSAFSICGKDLFEDSELRLGTLSENMTPEKQACIIENIKSFDLCKYAGVIILHGTDTLAYTASLFSMIFAKCTVPIMLVSANKPPNDPLTNANDNFRCAVELIMNGISPNVYVPYRNSDGIMYLHIASTLMQCANFSEDFFNASPSHVFTLDDDVLRKCSAMSDSRNTDERFFAAFADIKEITGSTVLMLHPYVGLDYSMVDVTGIRAIVHGTYHSGTVCVERNDPDDSYGTSSILHLADICRNKDIPIYMVPCLFDSGQYSSIYDASQNGGIIPVNITVEAAYAKAMLGVMCGYTGKELNKFMLTDIAGEIIK